MIKRVSPLVAGVFCLGAVWVPDYAIGAPKIQFDQLLYDFGKTSQVATVSGIFKFANIGDDLLKLEQPQTSCGCAVAELNSNALPPGTTAELPFTLHLGFYRALLEKHITVRSNDPQTPEVMLTVKVDYTPLYELNPMLLSPNLAFGVNDTELFSTLTRTDGKPVGALRLNPSKPWITAKAEPGAEMSDASARIRIAIRRDGPPRRFSEYVHVYAGGQTNMPVTSIYLYGRMVGEVSLNQEALYWSITDAAKTAPDGPEAMLTQRVTLRSENGQPFEVKNPRSTLKGINLEVVAKDSARIYELVARLDEVPTNTVSGNVSLDTSIPAQPTIEVPVIVNVHKP